MVKKFDRKTDFFFVLLKVNKQLCICLNNKVTRCLICRNMNKAFEMSKYLTIESSLLLLYKKKKKANQ